MLIAINDEYVAADSIMRVGLHPADRFTMCITLKNGTETRSKIGMSESPLDALRAFAQRVKEATQ